MKIVEMYLKEQDMRRHSKIESAMPLAFHQRREDNPSIRVIYSTHLLNRSLRLNMPQRMLIQGPFRKRHKRRRTPKQDTGT